MMIEKIWARAIGHYIGKTDDDMPEIPIVTLREAKRVLMLKTLWVMLQVMTCLIIIASIIKHWNN